MQNLKIITVSDSCYEKKREDLSGIAIKEYLEDEFIADDFDIVPDEIEKIENSLKKAIKNQYDLIVTTGGTGFSKRDVTPEATMNVIEKRAYGIEIALISKSMEFTDKAMLSRAICGICDKSLIINLPGSPKACKENLSIIKPVLKHAIKMIGTKKGELHDEI
ncbi:MAG: MogA/MoaB family molybdenum cofactor biosynthesis protein [Tissierellia bacterium]|nr:MogA/MoaB family molybdenum cofactor biosynthesis protein [Tissierellia bacterium]